MNILRMAELVNQLVINEYGNKDNFELHLIRLWNEFDTNWQLAIRFRGKEVPITPVLPSYPNPANQIATLAGDNLVMYGYSCISHMIPSMWKGYQTIDNQIVKKPEEIDMVITRQLGCILLGGKYMEFTIMPENERFGYSNEEERTLEIDYL